MNNTQTPKKVMPEDIDPDLVERINTDCNIIGRSIIALTLAWIANNPIQATYKDIAALEQNELSVLDRVSGNTLTPARAATCWQRIAFLKKEPKFPVVLLQRGYLGMTEDQIAEINERILAAYKLGKGLK
jgi:hypothetical protein